MSQLSLFRLPFFTVVLITAQLWPRTWSWDGKDGLIDVDGLAKIDYGVDISFPMHHLEVSTNYPWLPHNVDPSIPTPEQYQGMPINPLGDRLAVYEAFMQGCAEKWAFGICESNEIERIEMGLRQPKSMKNYTELGYKKIRAPSGLFEMIHDFWQKNKDKAKTEQWGKGNTYTNNWLSPSQMVAIDDSSLRGGGQHLQQEIWDSAKEILSEWTGQELDPTSLYGIRIYRENSILATHVDRLPLVTSAIICVDQDLDAPWPLEVIGHSGKAVNVTMEPGDMVLYESHSVLHGRPFHLKGRFMANVFIHFEPVGHTKEHHNADSADIDGDDVTNQYRRAAAKGEGGHEHNNRLPSYVIPGSEEAHLNWDDGAGGPGDDETEQDYDDVFNHDDEFDDDGGETEGQTYAHYAAQDGDVELLEEELQRDKSLANARDANGWTPMHEAARYGHLEAVKLLVHHGADVNAQTYGDDGGSVLHVAREEHGDEHPVIEFLESMGALEMGPELSALISQIRLPLWWLVLVLVFAEGF